MPHFSVDPDIRKAKTLSTDFYPEKQFFEISKEKIFASGWHFLGRSDDFDSLKPVTLLPGMLDEPVLLSKNINGVKCLSNVCTHRGKILVEEPCAANLIRCGYHGRRFSLDGKFLSMPEFEGVEEFPSETDDLARIPFAEWNGFLFASLSPVEIFENVIADVVGISGIGRAELKLTSKKEYEVETHWALYCENYLEGFHIPFVHKALNEIVDYGTYTTELFRYSSVQTGFHGGGNVAAKYLFIFPNMMFNFYPWGVSVNTVRPVNSSRSVVEFLTMSTTNRNWIKAPVPTSMASNLKMKQ
jgi:choline monooxygenase